MFKIFNAHKQLTVVVSLISIALVVMFNVYFFTFGSTPSSSELVDVSEMADLPGADVTPSTRVDVVNTQINYLPILISLGVLVLGGTVFFVVAKMLDKKQKEQDQLFTEQLTKLASGLEAYRSQNGRYPLSSSYQPEHYTGIHFGKEWKDYGFPNDDAMKQIAADWPVVSASKLEQIVYYPRQSGQAFDLYAKIASIPKSDAHDYNAEDGLPRAWGEFNFKISNQSLSANSSAPLTPSIDSASQVANSAPLTPATATNAQAVATQSSISPQADGLQATAAQTGSAASSEYTPTTTTVAPQPTTQVPVASGTTPASTESPPAVSPIVPALGEQSALSAASAAPTSTITVSDEEVAAALRVDSN